MKANEIHISDLTRLLFGEVPPHFYIEVLLRLFILYLILMIAMRIMGKRLSSQLSRNEMAAVASLAAAAGIPLMNPDKGILPGLVVAAVIVAYQMLTAKLASISNKFESLTQDHVDALIEDGILNLDLMLKTRISRERVFAQLRDEEVSHLGMVKRLYFEAGGMFSFLQEAEPRPGLSIIPEWDSDMEAALHTPANVHVCYHCGNDGSTIPANPENRCGRCGNSKWVSAVVQKKMNKN